MVSNVRWVLFGFLFCGHALSAAEWTTVDSTSSVSFLAIQQGSPFEGEFGSFTAGIDFDTSDPASGSIVGVVEMGSVRTGDSERDRTLLDREWFDPNNHPHSRFESESIEATESGFRANGQLTLKGVTQPVAMDFTFEDTGSGTTAQFSGTFELERLQFGVGEGFWSDTSWTSNEVTVTVELDLEL